MESSDTLYIKSKWETELKQNISPETWVDICTDAHKVTSSNSWWEFRWKMIVRYFRNPHITSATCSCWRECGETNSNFVQTFWSCGKLMKYWEGIYSALAENKYP